MRKIREVLRLKYGCGQSYDAIAISCGICALARNFSGKKLRSADGKFDFALTLERGLRGSDASSLGL